MTAVTMDMSAGPAGSLDDQLLRQLVDRARAEGLKLTGESGLLGRLIKVVVESALFAVAIALGMRRGEALGLRWDDVDLVAGTVAMAMQLQRVAGQLRHDETKTDDSTRVVALPRPCVQALR